MHILFVTGEYPPMEGGVGAYTAALGNALSTQGVQVSVITGKQAGNQPAINQQDNHKKRVEADLASASAAQLQIYPEIDRWGWQACTQVLQRAQKIQADWIHVQYQTAAYGMNPSINLAPQRWRGKVKVAWSYHDLLVPYLFPKAGETIRRWITTRPAQTSDLVIVTNEGDRQQLAAQQLDSVKIPIGSNISGKLATSDDRQLQRRKRNFAHDDLVIGYFGFLNRSKGVDTALRTLHQLAKVRRNVHLLMIGDLTGASDPTNQHYYEEIEQMIIDLGLFERVRWTGREADAEVSADLSACDLLLLPYADGASLRRGTLMAALANGCPIITTTPTAPLPELVEGRDLLYIPAGDEHAALQAILRVRQDRQLAAQLRQNAFERSQLFTWASIAEQHRQCYSQCYSGKATVSHL